MSRDFKIRPTVNGANVLLAGDTVTADTELLAPAALADATANPTITSIAALGLGFNGTTWDRIRVANTGRLQIDVITAPSTPVTNVGTFAVQDSQVIVDNAGFTDGTSKLFIGGYVFDEVAGTALTENDAVAARVDSKRAQVLVIEDATTRGQRAAVSAAGRISVDASGVAVPITDNAGSLTVDNAGTFAVQATLASETTKVIGTVNQGTSPWVTSNGGTFSVQDSQVIGDNAAFTDGTSKLFVGGYVFDEVAGTALTENDAAAARIDSKRAVVGVIEDATTRGQRVAVSAAGRLSVDASGLTVPIAGNVAHDAVDSGFPIKIGGKAATPFPTAVSAVGDRVDAWFDLYGAQFVVAGTQASGSDAWSNASLAYSYVGGTNGGIVPGANYGYNGTTWDRLRTIDSLSTAPNVTTGIQAVGIGPGFDVKTNPANLATAVNSAITIPVNGADTISFFIGTTTTGTVAFEATADDTNWTFLGTFLMSNEADFSGVNATPTAGDIYKLYTSGWRQVRIRTVTTLGATVAVKTTAHVGGTPGFGPYSRMSAYNGVGWDRLRTVQVGDGTAVGILGAGLMGYNQATTGWDRVRVANTGRLQVDADTELPTAATLADATANPTVPGVGGFLMGFNGTTWDRIRTANTGRLQVDVISGGGSNPTYTEDAASAGAESLSLVGTVRQDTLASSTTTDGDYATLKVDSVGRLYVHAQGGVASGAADSGNPVKVGGRYNSLAPTLTDGQRGDLQLDAGGNLKVYIANYDTASTQSDTLSLGTVGLETVSALVGYNGGTWDRLRTLTAFNAAAASPPVGLLATVLPDRRYTSVSLGTVVNNTQTWDVGGSPEIIIFCGQTTTGTMIFEVTPDGTNWYSAETYDAGSEVWVSGQNLTPTNLKVYRIFAAGYRTVRARTVTTLGATVALTANVQQHNGIVRAIEVGNSPHAIGQAWISKTAQYTTTQTGVALWTPAAGKRIVVTSYQVQAGGTTGGTVQLWFGASGDTTYTRGTDLAIFDGEFLPSATLKPGVVQTGVWTADAADRILRVTDSAAINPLTFTVWGYETI